MFEAFSPQINNKNVQTFKTLKSSFGESKTFTNVLFIKDKMFLKTFDVENSEIIVVKVKTAPTKQYRGKKKDSECFLSQKISHKRPRSLCQKVNSSVFVSAMLCECGI